ncbi:MAG TPA: hypothetical protein VE959_35900 [Bryobacteraceae bacterium]|nr:hypothetical protein [Bryobacteraceae bacterium]
MPDLTPWSLKLFRPYRRRTQINADPKQIVYPRSSAFICGSKIVSPDFAPGGWHPHSRQYRYQVIPAAGA